MKKGLLLIVGSALLLSSCGTYEATGAYTGAQFGHVIGSAIGGIAGGWRGHELGSLIGTVGGTVVGAAIGSAAERSHNERVQGRIEQRERARQSQARREQSRRQQNDNYGYDQYGYAQGSQEQSSGYDPQGRGDDRITFAPATSSLEIRNAGVYERVRDGVLTRGEECTVVFEIFNTTDQTVYDVYPLVEDATGNKHVSISPNLRIESIAPHQGIRYTASILADSRLKDGEIQLMIGVSQGKQVVESQTRQFTIPTAKVAR